WCLRRQHRVACAFTRRLPPGGSSRSHFPLLTSPLSRSVPPRGSSRVPYVFQPGGRHINCRRRKPPGPCSRSPAARRATHAVRGLQPPHHTALISLTPWAAGGPAEPLSGRAEAPSWFRTLVPKASASRRMRLYPQAAARRLIAFPLPTSHFSLLTSHFPLLWPRPFHPQSPAHENPANLSPPSQPSLVWRFSAIVPLRVRQDVWLSCTAGRFRSMRPRLVRLSVPSSSGRVPTFLVCCQLNQSEGAVRHFDLVISVKTSGLLKFARTIVWFVRLSSLQKLQWESRGQRQHFREARDFGDLDH
ncbi:MAG: hypothetical protein RLZZ436_4433, partial [Planctomycetota bacterium]